MKTKIDVLQKKDNPVHRWNVYDTFADKRDLYKLYFKNRYNTKNGWEKYDNLIPLDNDYILYKLFEKTTGVKNSIWNLNRPDKVQYERYQRAYDTLGSGLTEEDYKYHGEYIPECYWKVEPIWGKAPNIGSLVDDSAEILHDTFKQEDSGIQEIEYDENGYLVLTDKNNVKYQANPERLFTSDFNPYLYRHPGILNNAHYIKIYEEKREGTGKLWKTPHHEYIFECPLYEVTDDVDITTPASLNDTEKLEKIENWKQSHLLDDSIVKNTIITVYLVNSYSDKDYLKPNSINMVEQSTYIAISVKRELNIDSFMVGVTGANPYSAAQDNYWTSCLKKINQNYYYDYYFDSIDAKIDGYVYSKGNYILWDLDNTTYEWDEDYLEQLLSHECVWISNNMSISKLIQGEIFQQEIWHPSYPGDGYTANFLDLKFTPIITNQPLSKNWTDFDDAFGKGTNSGITSGKKLINGGTACNFLAYFTKDYDKKIYYNHYSMPPMNKISWDEDNINYLPTISVTATDAIPTTIGVKSPIQATIVPVSPGQWVDPTKDYEPYLLSEADYPETGEREYWYIKLAPNPDTEEFYDIGLNGGLFYKADYVLWDKWCDKDTGEILQDWTMKSDWQNFWAHFSQWPVIAYKEGLEWYGSLNDDNFDEILDAFSTTTPDGKDGISLDTYKLENTEFYNNINTKSVDVFADIWVGTKNGNRKAIKACHAKISSVSYALGADRTWHETELNFGQIAWKINMFFRKRYREDGSLDYDYHTGSIFVLEPKICSNAVLIEHFDDYREPGVMYLNELEKADIKVLVPIEDLAYKYADGQGTINYQWPADAYHGFNGGITQTHTTITENTEDFNLRSNEYLNGDIISFEGSVGYEWIDLNTIRYGFSYETEEYVPYRSYFDWATTQTYQNGFYAYVDYDTVQEMYKSWYTTAKWKPEYVYKITGNNSIVEYEKVAVTDIEHNWNIIGISPYYILLRTSESTATTEYEITEENKRDILYPLVFELTNIIPAYTFSLSNQDYVWTWVYPPFEEPNPESVYEFNQRYTVIKPSKTIKEWKYITASEYAAADEERWLTQAVYEMPAGSYVPQQHWPQMLYEDTRYDDVELVTDFEKIYPDFGYYPPGIEMLPDNFQTEIEEGASIYRYIGNINEYYATSPAGEIYLTPGADIEQELLLTKYDEPAENNNIETNPYGYQYIGEVDYINKNKLDHVETSTDFGAYPKDGVLQDGYWYEYLGTDENLEYSWGDEELRSNAIFNIDINSAQDFTIGDVAGASFTVDIQGNVRENIQYLGRKCKLFFDFENKGEYKDFGLFTIEDVKFMNHQVSTITAYDNIKKFDVPVYEYLTSEAVSHLFPMTAKTLFQLMCEYCEVPYYTNAEFLNSDRLCTGTFGDANLTARQVLSYIAEIAAGYIVCDTNGYAVIKTHKPYKSIKDYNYVPYVTSYENINLISSKNKPTLVREEYKIKEQSSQRMDIFPTEIIDSIVFNNVDTNSFINYRKELNAIYDMSDNPFVNTIKTQDDANDITDAILDQIAILVPPLYKGDPQFYAGTIELKNFDYADLGGKQIVDLLDEVKEKDFFVPTAISINASGITLTAKGQPKYSTKIVNSELAKQVNSLKMSVKEVKLSIPDALAETLIDHSEEINTLQSDVSTAQAAIEAVEVALQQQQEDTEAAVSTINARDDGQDARLDAIEAYDEANTTTLNAINTAITAIQQTDQGQATAIANLQSAVGTNTSNISQNTNDIATNTSNISTLSTTVSGHTTDIGSLQTTVGNIPTIYATKQEVADNNSITSSSDTVTIESGGDTMTLTASNGYLTITKGSLSWTIKLEVE